MISKTWLEYKAFSDLVLPSKFICSDLFQSLNLKINLYDVGARNGLNGIFRLLSQRDLVFPFFLSQMRMIQ